MDPNRILRQCVWLLASALALLAGCDSAPDDSDAAQIRQRLIGTWLRDYEEHGAHIRRVLELDADGHFRESSRVVAQGAEREEHVHAGEWTYDGTNLKRRYTSVDGKPPAAPAMPYATFQIQLDHNEFVGVDNVRKREVHYERVHDGTVP